MAVARVGKAIVIGGSMSGLLSGLLLRRAGWAVDIYERVESELSGRGAGIVAQAELIERLRALGLKTDALGVHITTRKIIDSQGRLTEEVECPQVLTAWERVYRLLRDTTAAGASRVLRRTRVRSQRIFPMVKPSKRIC